MKCIKKYYPLIIAGLFFIIWAFLWRAISEELPRDMYLMTDTTEYHNLITWQLTEGETVRQSFVSRESVYALDLFLERYDDTQDVKIKVTNESDDLVIADEITPVSSGHTRIILKDTKYYGKEKKYSVTIQKTPGDKMPIQISITEDNLYSNGNMFINETEQSCDLAFKIYSEQQHQSAYWIMHLIYTAIILLVILILWYSKWPFEKQFLLLLVTVGSIFVFLFTPQTVHDEDVHIDDVYRLCNMVLGKGYSDEQGNMLMREEDLKVYQLTGRNSLQNHEYILLNSSLLTDNNQMIQVKGEKLSGNPFVYLPIILGMCLGRLLGLSCFPMFFLGKIFGLLFFSICMYSAIKITPIGKPIFAVTALLPMTLQQTVGITYDSSLNAIALLTVALGIKLVYEREKFTKWNWCSLILFGGWLILFKRGVYCFILLFIFLYLVKSAKKLNKKIICIVVLMFGLVILINRGIIVSLILSLSEVVPAGDKYSYAFILQEPKEFLVLLWNTLLTQGSIWIETMIGSKLAWSEIPINSMILVSFGALLFVSTIHVEGEERKIIAKDKIIFGLICILVVGAITMAALGWTDIELNYIWGIQGRYFIPILPILLLMLDNFNLTFKIKDNRYILIIAGFLHIFVNFDICKFILLH